MKVLDVPGERARIAAALHRMHLYPNTAAENAGTADAPEWRFADLPEEPPESEPPDEP